MTVPRRRSPSRKARLQAADSLARQVVIRRHDGEMRAALAHLLAGETVDGVTLDGYLRGVAARRRQEYRLAARQT